MADEKRCFRCNSIKALAEFYPHPMMGDGHLNKCRSCTREDVRKNREARADYYAEYDRLRYLAAGHRSPPEVRASHNAVKRAIRAGLLVRASACEECGRTDARLDGAHFNYTEPLRVRWLCRPCHVTWDSAEPKSRSVSP